MTSLADVGPLSKTVEVRPGLTLTLRGLHLHDVFMLLEQFPELKLVISQRAINGNVALSIIEGIPSAIGSIIASACGEGDNHKAVAGAQRLTVGEQTELLEYIAEMTFPKGLRSFVTSLEKLISQASGGGHGWAAGTKSLDQSKSASNQDTDSKIAGDGPQGNSTLGQASHTENEPA